MARGALTDQVKELSKELMGEEITVKGLRLLPYIMMNVMDNTNLQIERMNQDDREVLSGWRDKGYVNGGLCEFNISSEFYDIMTQLLKIGYASEMIK